MTGLVVFIIVVTVISIAIVVVTAWFFSDSSAFHGPVWTRVAAFCCLLVFGTMTWWNWSTTYKNDHWATCTITGKDRGGDDGSYRIYTSDCGQLANEDSILRAKFNSADVWQEIPGKGVVKLRIAGVRWGVVSQFPNVFDVREVETQN